MSETVQGNSISSFGVGRRFTPAADTDPVAQGENDTLLARKASRAYVEELASRVKKLEEWQTKVSAILGNV